MRPTNRRRAVYVFVPLCVLLVGLAAALNVGWIILNWREGVLVFFGIVFFAIIIAGVIINTIFLVREIRRNEQQDAFLNTVTHELKTPIASIRLYLETLQRREVEPAKAKEFYGLMLADTDRLMGTVEQVLKAGALGHKALVQNALEVDINELLTSSADLVRRRHNLHGEALTISQIPDQATIIGNADELRSVFINVLDNAVKYSDPESVQVRVIVRELGPEFEVVVSDNGRGIPQSELRQVFKRFYRVLEPGQKVKGTGLGLFIVQGIVRKHGGTVAAESTGTGGGATIRIRLPKVYAA